MRKEEEYIKERAKEKVDRKTGIPSFQHYLHLGIFQELGRGDKSAKGNCEDGELETLYLYALSSHRTYYNCFMASFVSLINFILLGTWM